MARRKKVADPVEIEQPEVKAAETEVPEVAPEISAEAPAVINFEEPMTRSGTVKVADVEPKASYTDEEQAAYFGANLTADVENRKPDADIHAWYRRTGGVKGGV